jgi:ActR/RegA family two-component response regulator
MIEFNSQERSSRPRLLLAYADSAYGARIVRTFRRLGWEVHMAANGSEATRLAQMHVPTAVVIELGLPDEAGWTEHDAQHVVLLANETHDSLLRSSGAPVVSREDGMEGLVRAVYGHTLAKAV